MMDVKHDSVALKKGIKRWLTLAGRMGPSEVAPPSCGVDRPTPNDTLDTIFRNTEQRKQHPPRITDKRETKEKNCITG